MAVMDGCDGGNAIPREWAAVAAGRFGDVVHPVFVNEAAYYYAQSGVGIGIATPQDLPLEPES